MFSSLFILTLSENWETAVPMSKVGNLGLFGSRSQKNDRGPMGLDAKCNQFFKNLGAPHPSLGYRTVQQIASDLNDSDNTTANYSSYICIFLVFLVCI